MALGDRRKHKQKFVVPKLQITSMMDMFTIILIFLLLSYSDNPEDIKLDKNLQLPESIAKQNYKDNIKLVLSPSAVLLEGKVIAKIENGKVVGLDPSNLKSSSLYQELKAHREKSDREKAKEQSIPQSDVTDNGSEDDAAKDSHILFLCDKRLKFNTINSIIKTAGMAGYPNFQFAVLKKDQT